MEIEGSSEKAKVEDKKREKPGALELQCPNKDRKMMRGWKI